jgi:hypothetical protein
MSEDKTIIIVGDSWAAGTWDKDIWQATTPGVCGHLSNLGFQIINLAKPGGSNLESVDRLRDYLSCNTSQITHIKFILFWQTEFFREVWYYKRKTNIWESNLAHELSRGYSRLKDRWIHQPYHKLAKISQQWQVPIYVVGGCSDTVWYDDFEKDFPGVKIICQSITQMLIHGCHRIDQPVFCEFFPGWIDEGEFLTQIKKDISVDDLKLLLADMELGAQRIKTFSNHKNLFYPDGIHPNEHAHRMIFDFLCQQLPELTNEVA